MSNAPPVIVVVLPGLIFLPLNVKIFNLEGEFDPGDVSRKQDAWTPLDLWAGPLKALSVLQTRRRSSHLLGVAALDVRGCAIKFLSEASESPFDLLLNTGSFCPADSIVSFSSFVLGKFLPTKLARAATLRNAVARGRRADLASRAAALRRASVRLSP